MEHIKYTPDYKIDWFGDEDSMPFREKGPCTVYDDGLLRFSQINVWANNRVSGPSYISPDGEIQYTNRIGQYHRTDGPAIIHENGSKEYWVKDLQLDSMEFFLKYGVQ